MLIKHFQHVIPNQNLAVRVVSGISTTPGVTRIALAFPGAGALICSRSGVSGCCFSPLHVIIFHTTLRSVTALVSLALLAFLIVWHNTLLVFG